MQAGKNVDCRMNGRHEAVEYPVKETYHCNTADYHNQQRNASFFASEFNLNRQYDTLEHDQNSKNDRGLYGCRHNAGRPDCHTCDCGEKPPY